MNSITETIKAVVLGHAVGDALGVPVEFCDREVLDADPVTSMRGFGTYDVPAGAWSDDTSMSLAALDSLANGTFDMFEIMGNFVKWLEKGAYTPTGVSFDVGRTCLHAIIRFMQKGKNECFDITSCGGRDEYSNGNGSLMRIHPFSLMAYYHKELREEWEPLIDTASALTHAHERSILACRIYNLILFQLLEDPSREAIGVALAKAEERYHTHAEYGAYSRLFSPDFSSLPREAISGKGYVVDTLEAAVWCLLTTDNYRDCVLKAVNLGRDTDTVGAVAGGLAGALYGYEAIPGEWLDVLLRRDYIEDLCERAGQLCKERQNA